MALARLSAAVSAKKPRSSSADGGIPVRSSETRLKNSHPPPERPEAPHGSHQSPDRSAQCNGGVGRMRGRWIRSVSRGRQ